MNDFRCDFCDVEQDILYEAWFYTAQKNNPWAEGTASAGLMQFKRACKICVKEAIQNKLLNIKNIPPEIMEDNNDSFDLGPILVRSESDLSPI